MPSDWMFDERRHAGEEHLDPAEVARFDEKMPFDPKPEVDLLLELGLSPTDTVVDFGTGTGQFPLEVAPHCHRIVAVDVSEAMVTIVREKYETQAISNVEVARDGFLSYEHEGDPASFVFSKDALHHLPDFWKIEALKNMGNTLRDGGILRLRDFVCSFSPNESMDRIDTWIEDKKETTPFTNEEIYRHFREEYSTYGFLLESMLEAAGFEIRDVSYDEDLYAAYTCVWHAH